MSAPRLILAPPQRRRVRELAEAAWPQEACGLIEGSVEAGPVRVAAVHTLFNHADDPTRGYLVDPEAFLRLERGARARGRGIVGVWHSHPHGDAAPSERDRGEAWPGWSYLIAGVTNSSMTDLRCWRLDGDDFAEQLVAISPEPL
jgi:proteasome lid subunit RPN8/RPN11